MSPILKDYREEPEAPMAEPAPPGIGIGGEYHEEVRLERDHPETLDFGPAPPRGWWRWLVEPRSLSAMAGAFFALGFGWQLAQGYGLAGAALLLIALFTGAAFWRSSTR